MTIVIIFFVTLITTLGDYFLKLASSGKHTELRWFFVGWVIYSISAFCWFFVYRQMKLASVGVLYGLFTVMFFTFYTVVFFKESLTVPEIVGIALGGVSIVLLSRFS